MDALGPRLVVRVLGLHHAGAGELVGEVAPADLVVVRQRVIGGQPLVPGERQGLALSREVVLDVALGAHEGAHLLRGGHGGDVVVLDALPGLVLLDPLDERRPGDPQRHRLRIVAVQAADRMFDQLRGVRVGHLVHRVEAGLGVPVAQLVHQDDRRGVAVEARARLLELGAGHPQRVALVGEHPLVTARLAVVDRERVPLPHRDQPRVCLDLAGRGELARVVLRGRARDDLVLRHLGGPPERLVLQREVLPPHRRVLRLVGHLDHLEERLLGLAASLDDADQQRDDGDRHECSADQEHRGEKPELALGGRLGFVGHRAHLRCPTLLWHWRQLIALSCVRVPSISETSEPWQYRHASSVIWRLTSRILMFSG